MSDKRHQHQHNNRKTPFVLFQNQYKYSCQPFPLQQTQNSRYHIIWLIPSVFLEQIIAIGLANTTVTKHDKNSENY